jgi:hypothetical protein
MVLQGCQQLATTATQRQQRYVQIILCVPLQQGAAQ